ncbi:MAG TPA: rod-binding protein [Thermodesulfobacteriota bacterium]|nr:rod-binding protein [Thermodesulfobacteriota bacterium]
MERTLHPLVPAKGGGDRKADPEKLKKACTEFEALFMSQMLKHMRQSVPKGGLFGKGLGSEVFQSLMDEELSRKVSAGKGLGLGNSIYRQMMKREEKKSPDLPAGPKTFLSGTEGGRDEKAGRASSADLPDDGG